MKTPGIDDGRVSNKVVFKLLESYLDQGRTLVVDNYYTNMELATKLLEKNTHVVGTMRKVVKHVPRKF